MLFGSSFQTLKAQFHLKLVEGVDGEAVADKDGAVFLRTDGRYMPIFTGVGGD